MEWDAFSPTNRLVSENIVEVSALMFIGKDHEVSPRGAFEASIVLTNEHCVAG